MYKQRLNQVTIFEDPAMFDGISLNPNNARVKPTKLIPWWVLGEKYARKCRYFKSHHIHLNDPTLGRPTKDPKVRKSRAAS